MLSKKNVISTIVTLGIIFLMSSNNVFGENLVNYHTNKDGSNFYYDKDSTKRSSGKVKVWTIEKHEGESLRRYLNLIQQIHPNIDFSNYSYTKALDEIDCNEDKARTLSIIHYNLESKVITTVSGEAPWEHLVPETIHNELKRIVCK